jgi:hypothetical protein
MEWHYAGNKPANYRTEQPADMIFCDGKQYYLGRLNFDGKWFDYQSQEFKDDIDCWASLPDEPVSLGSATVVSEWNIGHGPVSTKFRHYLLYDRAISEMVYRDITSSYFDSKNATFPEVSYWIALPNLPMHCRNIKVVKDLKEQFLIQVNQKLGKDIVLQPFNEECLSQSIGELVNTTINGVPEPETLNATQLFKEILSRWYKMVNLWLNNTTVTSKVNFTFGTTKVPGTANEREQIKATLEMIIAGLVKK